MVKNPQGLPMKQVILKTYSLRYQMEVNHTYMTSSN